MSNGKGAAALKERVTGNGQAEQQERSPYVQFSDGLEKRRSQFKALMGSDEAVNKFIQVALNAVQQTPALLGADPRSLLISCMKAAQDGLLPNGREAVFNIYNTKVKTDQGERWVPTVQYLPMVGGLIKKLYDSGHVSFVDAAAVYERDVFEYERGDNPKLLHRPTLADEPGPIVAAYVVVKLTSGEIKREVMARRDIEKVRAASKAADGPGWTTWYDQFAIKSVIKRSYKQLPSSRDLERVIASDNEAMGFTSSAVGDVYEHGPQQPALPEHAGGEAPPPMNINQQEKTPATPSAPAQPPSSGRSPRNAPAAEASKGGEANRAAMGAANHTNGPDTKTPASQQSEGSAEPSALDELLHVCKTAEMVDDLDFAADLRRGLTDPKDIERADAAIAEASARVHGKAQ